VNVQVLPRRSHFAARSTPVARHVLGAPGAHRAGRRSREWRRSRQGPDAAVGKPVARRTEGRPAAVAGRL